MKNFNDFKIKLSSILILFAIIGWSSDVFAQWQYNGSSIYYNEGNVGIGTSNPQQKLHVKSSNTSTLIRLEPNNGSRGQITMYNDGGLLLNSYTSTLGPADIRICGGNVVDSRLFILKSNGNVGIGISNPQQKLHVHGNILIDNSNYGLILTSPNGQHWKLTVDNSGNLSVGAITDVREIEPGEITDVKEIEPNYDIDIYPNPTSNTINIEIHSLRISSFDAEIYNVQGKLVFMKHYIANSTNIDISDLSNGTYILKLKDMNGNMIKTEKVVKE
jgi:hypothetical protein